MVQKKLHKTHNYVLSLEFVLCRVLHTINLWVLAQVLLKCRVVFLWHILVWGVTEKKRRITCCLNELRFSLTHTYIHQQNWGKNLQQSVHL